MIAFHSGDNRVPHGRSDGTILQFATKSSLLLAIGGIKPNSKWTPVDPARWYHDPKNSQITQTWELEGRLILRENLVASLRQIFSNRPPLSLEKSTTVSALFTTCTVQRLGAADRVNLASDWLIRCVNTCTNRFVTLSVSHSSRPQILWKLAAMRDLDRQSAWDSWIVSNDECSFLLRLESQAFDAT